MKSHQKKHNLRLVNKYREKKNPSNGFTKAIQSVEELNQ